MRCPERPSSSINRWNVFSYVVKTKLTEIREACGASLPRGTPDRKGGGPLMCRNGMISAFLESQKGAARNFVFYGLFISLGFENTVQMPVTSWKNTAPSSSSLRALKGRPRRPARIHVISLWKWTTARHCSLFHTTTIPWLDGGSHSGLIPLQREIKPEHQCSPRRIALEIYEPVHLPLFDRRTSLRPARRTVAIYIVEL